jgi:hypothetical protein
MQRALLILFIFTLIGSQSFSQVTLQQIDPFVKVMRTEKTVTAFNEIHPVAFDEILSVQLLLKSTQKKEGIKLAFLSPKISQETFNRVKTYRQSYIKVSPKIHAPSNDKLSSPDNFFPDPLFPEKSFSLASNIGVPITLEFPITSNIPPGIHIISVTATDALDKVLAFTSFTIQVYNVKVPAKKMNYSNWYHDVDYALMNNGKPVKNFSTEYWAQFKKIVQATKDYGQNIFTINPMFLIQFKKNKQTYSADYTQLDKAISIILDDVGMDYVLARQFALRKPGWEDPFALQMPKFYSDTEYIMDTRFIKDGEVIKFYNWFLPSYYTHLKNRQLLPKYLQHIADEPIAANETSYREIASFIRKKTPGLKIIEAVNDANLVDYIDILVVQLGELSFRYDDVIRRIQSKKKEIWFYTANHPQGNYANRFIELPLIKTRLLPWVGFRYNLNGYLHWGLNFWGRKPYEDATKVQFDGTIEFPGGDAYIIYPGYQSVVISTRFIEMRNGLNDVALLNLLKAKNPKAATNIALQLVKDFQNYNTDTRFFMARKKEVLELLTK